MADSNAERQRRKRAHTRGDHSLCSPDRCPDLLAKLPSGRVAVVAAKLVEGLGLAEDDPRRLDAEVLLALAPRVDRGDTTAARELRRIAAVLPVERPPDTRSAPSLRWSGSRRCYVPHVHCVPARCPYTLQP